MDVLTGKNEFGFTGRQIDALHKRIAVLEGADKAHSISFATTAAGGWSNECCKQPMIKLCGHKKPHEEFERCKTPACSAKSALTAERSSEPPRRS